jgi:mannonate dehydratase
MMKDHKNITRRDVLSSMLKCGLGTTMAFGAIGSSASSCKPAEDRSPIAGPGKPMLMKVGCQHGGTDKNNLEFLARHGVFNIDGGSPEWVEGLGWDLAELTANREACDKYGIHLDAYHLPLSSAGIERTSMPNIMLGESPGRDREIEILQQMISVAGRTGVKVLNYNTTIHRVLRTGKTLDPARGNAFYSTWDYEAALAQNEPNTIAGEVSTDEIYERITYLLDRLLPVAEEYHIKLANHIADPPVPEGYRGITRWNSPDVFEGIKRFGQLYNSPSHGFNLCIGSVASGLKDPKTEILPIIKWVGERKQIFNVHLRNIKGGWNHFQEVYPDNGDLDLAQIIRALWELDYDGMVMPDHVPYHEDPASELQGRAFAFGYIRGLIHAQSFPGTEP